MNSHRSYGDGLVHDIDFSHTPRVNIDESHVVKEPEIVAPVVVPVPEESKIVEVDINLIKNVWPFLRPTTVIPADARLKFSVELCRDLLDELKDKQT